MVITVDRLAEVQTIQCNRNCQKVVFVVVVVVAIAGTIKMAGTIVSLVESYIVDFEYLNPFLTLAVKSKFLKTVAAV